MQQNVERNEHGWIAEVIKSLSSVVLGSGFDPGSSREFVRTDTNL